jgi:hypothetical protein
MVLRVLSTTILWDTEGPTLIQCIFLHNWDTYHSPRK